MSQSSHHGDIVVGQFDLPAGHWFSWHDHDEHQLAWASSGVLSVQTAAGVWVLPPTRALWIPAGIGHRSGASTTAVVRTLYIRAGDRFTEPTAVAVDDVLAALIGYLGRATALARRLSANPADDRDLPAWGREVGASARTLARLFADETGLSFGRWRTQPRMRAALIHLAAGTPVTAVARRVGYRTPSAFVAAFRQALGTPPGSFFNR
jgi:AraC-like DNA-binding protein